jgi:hypothetical protein
VVAVAQAAVPGVEWSKAGVDVDADTMTPVYEITGTKDGKQVEVDVTPTGEIDVEISEAGDVIMFNDDAAA